MTIPITNAIPMCTCFRILLSAASSFLCAFRISTVKEVVRAVKAGVRRSYQSDNEQDTDYSRKVIACGDHWEQFIALTGILDSLSGGESIEQDTQHQEEQDHKEL